MRKFTLGLAGAVALASASAAQATITIDPDPTHTNVFVTDFFDDVTSGYITYQKPVGQTGSFNSLLTFSNDLSGIYNLAVITDLAAAVTFSSITISGGTLSGALSFDGPSLFNNANTWALSDLDLGVGTYQVNLVGNAPRGTTWQGTLNWAQSGVPEPATWAFMLLGFGAIGASMRRRRNVATQFQIA